MQTFQTPTTPEWRPRLEFSPDGTFLGVESLSRYTLFDTSGTDVPRVMAPLEFGRAGRLYRCGEIAVAQLVEGNTVLVCDTRTGSVRHLADGYPNTAVASPADGRLFVSVWIPGELPLREEVWVIDTARTEPTGFTRNRWDARWLAISADGRRLAGYTTNPAREYFPHCLRVWDLSGTTMPRRARVRLLPRNPVQDFALTHDGGLLAVADGYGISLRGTTHGERVAHSGQHRRAVTAVACSPKQPLLVTGDNAGNVFLWDTKLRVLKRYAWGLGVVYGLAFDADGLRCAAVDDTGKVVVWDMDG